MFFNINFLFAETILERLSKWNVLTGLILALVGFALMVSSNFIAAKIFKNKTKEEQVTYSLRLKMASAVFALAGLILAVLIP